MDLVVFMWFCSGTGGFGNVRPTFGNFRNTTKTVYYLNSLVKSHIFNYCTKKGNKAFLPNSIYIKGNLNTGKLGPDPFT